MDYSRQRDLFNPETFEYPVTLIGAGATGSWIALILAKLGIKNITVYDFDKVEEHNLPNQLYFLDGNGSEHLTDIGILKVDALQGIIRNATGTEITTKPTRVNGEQRLSGIVFMLTDTMKSRKEIYEKAVRLKPGVQLLIETRMGLSDGRIYTVKPCDLKQLTAYEKTFYGDDVAPVSACGASQSVITTAMSIASMAVRQMINWHNGVPINNELLFDFENNAVYPTVWE